LPPSTEHKVNLTLSLPADPIALASVRQGRPQSDPQGERSGLSIEIGGTENLTAFYDTFVVRMRDLGSPVHGPEFLRAVLEAFGARAGSSSSGRATRPSAARCPVVQGSSDRSVGHVLQDYFPLCPNMLLYWETIRTACLEAIAASSSVGRREIQVRIASRRNGRREEPLFWYTIPIARSGTRRLRITAKARFFLRRPGSVSRSS